MKRNFTYEVLEGDAKTVGRMEAQGILEAWPGAREFYANPLGGNAERLKEGEKLLEHGFGAQCDSRRCSSR